jgi:luciferase family oxidoreductase group 1
MSSLSVLDLSPITQGSDAAASFARSLDLARHAEQLGYQRYWLAEHHGMPGIASAATAVLIGHIAGGTRHIRVGAGGIMLPNHAPLQVAEQFGTLAALYPGRIDLGLGRAPGSDPATARALRRHLQTDPEAFDRDVLELQAYFAGRRPFGVRAVPGEGADVPLWILGSSLYGAQMAARFGLPYAFASHFAPAQMMEAITLYRQLFQPSAVLNKPRVMLGVNAFVADTEAEARLLMTSLEQAFVALRSGQPVSLPPPQAGFTDSLSPAARATLEGVLACSVVGTPDQAASQLRTLADRTAADEFMVTAQIFDHEARCRSFALLMHAWTA